MACVCAAAIAWRVPALRLEAVALAGLLLLAVVGDVLQLGQGLRKGASLLLDIPLTANVVVAWHLAGAAPPRARRVARAGLGLLAGSFLLGIAFHLTNEPLHLWVRRGDVDHEVHTLLK